MLARVVSSNLNRAELRDAQIGRFEQCSVDRALEIVLAVLRVFFVIIFFNYHFKPGEVKRNSKQNPLTQLEIRCFLIGTSHRGAKRNLTKAL